MAFWYSPAPYARSPSWNICSAGAAASSGGAASAPRAAAWRAPAQPIRTAAASATARRVTAGRSRLIGQLGDGGVIARAPARSELQRVDEPVVQRRGGRPHVRGRGDLRRGAQVAGGHPRAG